LPLGLDDPPLLDTAGLAYGTVYRAGDGCPTSDDRAGRRLQGAGEKGVEAGVVFRVRFLCNTHVYTIGANDCPDHQVFQEEPLIPGQPVHHRRQQVVRQQVE
jgi:hypothetical protein